MKTEPISNIKECLATQKDIKVKFSAWLDERCIDSTKFRVIVSPFVFTVELVDA